MKIGIISDTHGHLDRRVETIFAGVDHILHAGDIGDALIALELQFIAPVTAVLGNCDSLPGHRITEIIELAGKKFLIHHIVNPWALTEPLAKRIAKEKPAVVVFGHTHRRFAEQVNGVFFLNPGYAGKPKLGTERSVALLHVEGQNLRHELIPL